MTFHQTITLAVCASLSVAMLASPALSQGCDSISFEPDALGKLPDGTVAADNLPIDVQFLRSHGVMFGIDDDLDGVADPGVLPVLEMAGQDDTDGFVTNQLDRHDQPLPGFEEQMGTYFLRPPTAPGEQLPQNSNILITYAEPVAALGVEVWDLDGVRPDGTTEQWRLDAIDANGKVIDSVFTPDQVNLTYDGRPYSLSIDHCGVADIHALRVVFTGSKASGTGVAFDNFLPQCVKNTAWSREGSGLAGTSGDPVLFAGGTMARGSCNSVILSNARPSSVSALFFSLASTPVSFKGGTLRAFPFVGDPMVALTNPRGVYEIHFTMPGWAPSGTEVWLQWAVLDPAAIQGVALSNATRGITP